MPPTFPKIEFRPFSIDTGNSITRRNPNSSVSHASIDRLPKEHGHKKIRQIALIKFPKQIRFNIGMKHSRIIRVGIIDIDSPYHNPLVLFKKN